MSHKILFFPGWAISTTVIDQLATLTKEHLTFHIADYHRITNAKEFDTALLKQIDNIKPTYIAGWSLGAMIALRIIPLLPEQIKGIIMFSGFSSFIQTNEHLSGWPIRIVHRMKQKLLLDRKNVLEKFTSDVFSSTESHAQPYHAISDSDYSTEELCAGLDYLSSYNAQESLSKIMCPSLLLHGSADNIVPISSCHHLLTYLSRHTTGFISACGMSTRDISTRDISTQCIFPNAGHALLTTQPQWCAQKIITWLDTLTLEGDIM